MEMESLSDQEKGGRLKKTRGKKKRTIQLQNKIGAGGGRGWGEQRGKRNDGRKGLKKWSKREEME